MAAEHRCRNTMGGCCRLWDGCWRWSVTKPRLASFGRLPMTPRDRDAVIIYYNLRN